MGRICGSSCRRNRRSSCPATTAAAGRADAAVAVRGRHLAEWGVEVVAAAADGAVVGVASVGTHGSGTEWMKRGCYSSFTVIPFIDLNVRRILLHNVQDK